MLFSVVLDGAMQVRHPDLVTLSPFLQATVSVVVRQKCISDRCAFDVGSIELYHPVIEGRNWIRLQGVLSV